MNEFSELLNLLAPKIAEHPEFGNEFDLNLANWLDTSGAVFNKYRAYKYSPIQGMVHSAELQARHLLILWKHHVGSGSATFTKFEIAIAGKPLTADIIEVIKDHIGTIRNMPTSSTMPQELGNIISSHLINIYSFEYLSN